MAKYYYLIELDNTAVFAKEIAPQYYITVNPKLTINLVNKEQPDCKVTIVEIIKGTRTAKQICKERNIINMDKGYWYCLQPVKF